jgi:hypothetical protein
VDKQVMSILNGKRRARVIDTDSVISEVKVGTGKSELGHMTTGTILSFDWTPRCIRLESGAAGCFISSCRSSLP